jgi:hypothetical protein
MFSRAERRLGRDVDLRPFFSILPQRTARDDIFASEDVEKKSVGRRYLSMVSVMDGCLSLWMWSNVMACSLDRKTCGR